MTVASKVLPPVHPFPARMASNVALEALTDLTGQRTVLDPMCGSGTVLRAALQQRHKAFGYDVDPLAVLISRVSSNGGLDPRTLTSRARLLVSRAEALAMRQVELPWIDGDPETLSFVKFWFGPSQRRDLRRLAFLLRGERGIIGDALRVAFSRLIITKDSGASLARDVSHSRPHKVRDSSDFDVLAAFPIAAGRVAERLAGSACGKADVRLGDARVLPEALNDSVDLIVTSPPYLNAIDYLRGHRLSLVWLGHSLSELREIRGHAVGTERGIDEELVLDRITRCVDGMNGIHDVAIRTRRMYLRYATDLFQILSSMHRVLKRSGTAVLVLGDSTIEGVILENAQLVSKIASLVGFREVTREVRQLPQSRRYLPPPDEQRGALRLRMRSEVVLSLARVGRAESIGS
jgi:DNA modification methylase